MDWLARFLGLHYLKSEVTVPEMDQRILESAKSDQAACDILNESRRKRGMPMTHCGEGYPSWEGQLTDKDPSWEGL